jgi:hypothetical protein
MPSEKDITEQTTENLEEKGLAAQVVELAAKVTDLENLCGVLRQRVSFTTGSLPGNSEEKLIAAGVRKCIYCNQGAYQVRFNGQTSSLMTANRAMLSLGIEHANQGEFKDWVVMNCDHCGNLQYFKLENEELLRRWQ